MITGQNIGDLLNDAGVTWGWFQGGFDLTATNANGTTGCARSTHSRPSPNFDVRDYVPHHEPFQYYATTANPTHARPGVDRRDRHGARHERQPSVRRPRFLRGRGKPELPVGVVPQGAGI